MSLLSNKLLPISWVANWLFNLMSHEKHITKLNWLLPSWYPYSIMIRHFIRFLFYEHTAWIKKNRTGAIVAKLVNRSWIFWSRWKGLFFTYVQAENHLDWMKSHWVRANLVRCVGASFFYTYTRVSQGYVHNFKN